MLVVFKGDMILKYNKGHQYTPFLTEAGCSNLASVFSDESGPSVLAGLVLTSKMKGDAASASGLVP